MLSGEKEKMEALRIRSRSPSASPTKERSPSEKRREERKKNSYEIDSKLEALNRPRRQTGDGVDSEFTF